MKVLDYFVISEIPKLVQLRVWCRWHNFKWGNLRVPANEGKYVRWPQLHNCPKLGEYPFLKNKFSHNSCHVYSKWDKKKVATQRSQQDGGLKHSKVHWTQTYCCSHTCTCVHIKVGIKNAFHRSLGSPFLILKNIPKKSVCLGGGTFDVTI